MARVKKPSRTAISWIFPASSTAFTDLSRIENEEILEISTTATRFAPAGCHRSSMMSAFNFLTSQSFDAFGSLTGSVNQFH